jgi:predicted transcriptional regulator
MNLSDLDKGEKTEIHLRLYANELAIIDEIAQRFNTSRAMVVGAMVRELAEIDMSERMADATVYKDGRTRRGRNDADKLRQARIKRAEPKHD